MMRAASVAACLLALTGCALSQPVSQTPPQLSMEREPERFVVVTVKNPAGPAIPRAGSTVRGYEAPAKYSVAPAARTRARAIATAHGLREVSAWPIGLLGVHCLIFEVPSQANRDELLERLRRDHRVEAAQPLQSFHSLTSEYNDPYRGLQRNLDAMGVVGAHAWSTGEGVRIAVIDTGVDANHPDLAGRIVKQQNFVDADVRTPAPDRHGTAVAGVIAAVANNQQGIVGIAPAASLYAYKACWPDATNAAQAHCNTLTLAKALSAAIEARIDIVNLSLTGPADGLLRRLVEIGIEQRMVFVGARPPQDAGNSFPTGIDGVIGVDASNGTDVVGAVLYAPGADVLTLVPDGRYDFMSGSSLAAASVSGGIALLLARDRTLRATTTQQILARSTRNFATPTGVAASINLCAALAAVLSDDASSQCDPLSR